MTTFTLARSQSFAVPRRHSLAIRLPLSLWNAALIGLVAVLGAWYLAQVNLTMARSYEIRDAQAKVAELQTAARNGQIKLTEMEAVGNLTAQATALGLVPVGGIEYVSRGASGMALR